MMATLIVVASVGLAAIFVVAWFARPGFREWIERPKHRFQEDLRQYDRDCRGEGGTSHDD